MNKNLKLADNTPVSVTCPVCGPTVKLIIKTSSINGSQFLGCPNFPSCRYTQAISEDLKLTLAGYQKLPGF